MSARILVIDDEAQIRKFLRISLGAQGYRVAEAASAAQGLAAIDQAPPDLVVLDLGLPDRDGQEVLSSIRQAGFTMPVIVLSVRAGEMDKVEALDRGANDYVSKPFGVAELMARIRALLRPRAGPQSPPLTVGSVVIDCARTVVTRAGAEVRLSKREWALLRLLAGQPDHVLTHKHILREVWGPAHVDDTAYLRVYVNQLRQKLEDDPASPRLIVTDPGVGYRLKSE
ncbi:DNA-binding response regulator in two-component regulatory system with KdpD [Magnetospirillum sp. LM-5]|uniref:response regulator n=1 Tax=Magnetospirillum sp. LM-5 TaxID=2681466 RepID=UPI00138473A5|nr:response regulator transcription factor [Magnetospirillum sp. LM-5]CAA7617661.1 DNA-binding response regulator in two-component regulatory system with KdpD [Magnetospirillum sp. LM-5]